jgi:uncharacterized protein with PIN domain
MNKKNVNKIDNETSQLKHSEFEHCTQCNSITKVRKDTQIEERVRYVEGSGQLCKVCYYEIYVKKG